MVNRRSLGNALSMTPDHKAFITGAASRQETVKIVQPDPIPLTQVVAETPRIEPAPEAEPLQVPEEEPRQEEEVRTQPRRTRSRNRIEKETDDTLMHPGFANLMMNISTRLQPRTGNALRRAVLEQRLLGAKPSTVQEIVEIAVKGWLDENGYI